jgi:hypothetical protein
MLWRSLLSLFRLSIAGYTDGAVNAVSAAWRVADSLGHTAMTLEHLRLGLAQPDGHQSRTKPGLPRCRGIGPEVWTVLAAARLEARRAGCNYVATEHLAAVLAANHADYAPDAAADRGQDTGSS